MTIIGKLAVAALVFATHAVSASLCAGGEATAAKEENHLRYVLSMDVDYPTLGDEEIDATVREWFEDILNERLQGLAGVALDPEMSDSVNEIRAGYELVHSSDRAVSVVFETYAYPDRAAHGTTRVDAANFDLRTREMLSLDDLFGNPDQAIAIMAEHAEEALMEHLRKTMPGMEADILFADGFAPARENFERFVIAPGGVRVIFQEYQVAPYALGSPEALYSLETLAPAEPRLEYWGGRPASQ